jgi:transposase, IS30 family
MKNKKPHLTLKIRIQIETLLNQGLSYRMIASALSIGSTTISDEVKRNGSRENYNAEKAHKRAHLRQHHKKKNCNKVAMNGDLARYVERRLEAGWSPETISLRIKQRGCVIYVSAKSIRKYIKKRGGLERHLYYRRVHKKSGKKRGSVGALGERNFIDMRPYTTLFEYGHWEGDFIVSKDSKWVLLVLVEKQTKFTNIIRLSNRNNSVVNKVKSLTLDNDVAFIHWRELEQRINTSIFFTHPYCSFEKGLVENMNRWIRQFVPKKTNIESITDEECQSIQDWLNHMPRQCLNGDTSYERMMLIEMKTLITSLEISLPRVSVFGG